MYDELLEKIKNKNLLKANNTLNTGKLQWLNKKKKRRYCKRNRRMYIIFKCTF